jgi:hypothetical protein
VALAVGSLYGLGWLLLGRPDWHLSDWFFVIGIGGGAASAALGPRKRWRHCVMVGGLLGFGATIGSRVVSAFGLVAIGVDQWHDVAGVLVVDLLALAFLCAAAVVIDRAHQPERRLSPELLATIPPPAASAFRPRQMMVRYSDGSSGPMTLMEGGYVAGWRHPRTDVVEVTDVDNSPRR